MERAPHLRLVTPHDEPTDDRLMVEAALGRRASFELLVRRHEARVRAFCLVQVRDRAIADELAQDVFLKLWEQRERYRPDGRLRELIFTIALNACRSHGRKSFVRSLFVARAERPESLPSHAGAVEASEERALLRAAIERLPEKFRVPLVLRFVEELPYDEIARVIGRTESATRSRIHYGLKALAELLPPEVLP